MEGLKLIEAPPEGFVRWKLDLTDFYANQNGSSVRSREGFFVPRGRFSLFAPRQDLDSLPES